MNNATIKTSNGVSPGAEAARAGALPIAGAPRAAYPDAGTARAAVGTWTQTHSGLARMAASAPILPGPRADGGP